MRELISRRAVRVLAVSFVALATAGATVGGAQATSTPRLKTGCSPIVMSLTGTKTSVVAIFDQECVQPGGETIVEDFPVSLSRLVNGTWVLLASGEGAVGHQCVGSTSYEYSGAGHTGTFACG